MHLCDPELTVTSIEAKVETNFAASASWENLGDCKNIS